MTFALPGGHPITGTRGRLEDEGLRNQRRKRKASYRRMLTGAIAEGDSEDIYPELCSAHDGRGSRRAGAFDYSMTMGSSKILTVQPRCGRTTRKTPTLSVVEIRAGRAL